MNGKQVIKLLKEKGWQLDRINGSHHIFKKEGIVYLITVPVHGSDDIPTGTLNRILKDGGLK